RSGMMGNYHVPFWRAVEEATPSLTLIILRKAIPNAFSNGIESCVVQPRRVNPLKVKVKGEGLDASHVM
ncbi:hypothetical protein QUA56_15470, partial [Microcoleus sp. N3A4]|uniref:hypothetical protein n=1 Tax=Microcoleus sp. N3A4 TaxID=3055379 RepID=UPI002FCE8053